MTDEKDAGQLPESQDEPMLSTGSSGASLSFEHLPVGPAMGNPENSGLCHQPHNIATVDVNFIESLLISGGAGDPQPEEPYLEITEQPQKKDLRFRYECEGRSAGSLLGVDSNSDRKTYPTVKIKNYRGTAKVVASLVTRQSPHQLHPNGLVGKFCKNGICTMEVKENQRMTVSFPNLGIQCAKKKDIASALAERRRLGVDPFNQSGAVPLEPNNEYEMNIVCLCFQAFLPDPRQPDQFTRALPSKVSHPVYNRRGASLSIARVDRTNGTVKGGDEIFILCDKVQRDDIEVVFFKDEWEAYASFGPSDIHRQVAIVCRTPRFKDLNIQEPIVVQFKLRRKSDTETSDPMEFTYVPVDTDAEEIEAKRRKKCPKFERFFAQHPVKHEATEQAQPCQSMAMTSQQGQRQQEEQPCSSTASSDPNVRQILRHKLKQNSSKHDNQQTDPFRDVRQPPSGFAHHVRPGNPSVAVFSEASSSYRYSNSSSMTFGTVTQCTPPATPTTITPFAMPQIPVPLATSSTQIGNQPPSVTNTITMVNSDEFSLMGSQPCPGNTTTIHEANNIHFSEEVLLQMIQNEDLLNCGNFGDGIEQNAVGGSEHLPSIEQLTMLQNFDPDTLSLQSNAHGMVEPMHMESVTDSLSIPYSNSVELEHEEMDNPNHDGNDARNG